MTGKQQKAINDKKDMLKRVELSMEDRGKIIDEAVLEIHAQHRDFLEQFKMPIKAFRGMYVVHTLFGMVDELVKEKCTQKLSENVQKYVDEENLKKRRK